MKNKGLVLLGLGAVAYYLWTKSKDSGSADTEEDVAPSRPNITASDGLYAMRDPMVLSKPSVLSKPTLPSVSLINEPNLGIPTIEKPTVSPVTQPSTIEATSRFSNIVGWGRHKTKGNCTVEFSTNNTKYKCKGKYVNGVCQPCAGNVVSYATDPNWEAQSVFSRLRNR